MTEKMCYRYMYMHTKFICALLVGEKAGPRGFTEGVLSQAVEKSRP